MFIDQMLRKALTVHGRLWKSKITRTQFTVLDYLDRHGPKQQGVLGEAIGMDRSTISEVIKRLKKDHLISVDRDDDDQRKMTISISSNGKQELKIARKNAEAADKTFLMMLKSVRERDEFIYALSQFSQAETKSSPSRDRSP